MKKVDGSDSCVGTGVGCGAALAVVDLSNAARDLSPYPDLAVANNTECLALNGSATLVESDCNDYVPSLCYISCGEQASLLELH